MPEFCGYFFPLSARRGGEGGCFAGRKSQSAHYRRVHGAPHRRWLGLRSARTFAKAQGGDCFGKQGGKSRLSRHGFYNSGSSAGKSRNSRCGLSACGALCYGLFGRRKKDDCRISVEGEGYISFFAQAVRTCAYA